MEAGAAANSRMFLCIFKFIYVAKPKEVKLEITVYGKKKISIYFIYLFTHLFICDVQDKK